MLALSMAAASDSMELEDKTMQVLVKAAAAHMHPLLGMTPKPDSALIT